MEVLITSLDALLHKATNASLERPDPAALDAFCAVLSDSPNGPYIATRAIASRIKSQHPTEALLALEVLDICMERCDVVFHAEIDKFRFLNEMIKLVSPKYYGNKTAPAVRQKVLELLYSWTIHYPHEIKVKDAYEMLKKQGVIKEVPLSASSKDQFSTSLTSKQQNKDNIFEDEERSKMLQKLLQSKNPDDLQAANRLIKTMVREGEKRTEAVSRRVSELQTIRNNVHLLEEMLDQYHSKTSSQEDLELINELYSECDKLQPTLLRLVSELRLASDTPQNKEMLTEVLNVSDELDSVFDKYSAVILHENSSDSSPSENDNLPNCNGTSLLDFASPAVNLKTRISKDEVHKNSNLEVLGDIFSSVHNVKEADPLSDSNMPVLKPVKCVTDKDSSQTKLKKRGLEELNALGEELLKSSLPVNCKSVHNFNSQKLDKITLNSLGKTSTNSSIDNCLKGIKKEDISQASSINSSHMLDLDFLISKTLKSEENTFNNTVQDDAMVDISSDDNLTDSKSIKSGDISLVDYLKNLNSPDKLVNLNTNEDKIVDTSLNISSKNYDLKNKTVNIENLIKTIKPLTDININLEMIQPGERHPLTIYEETNGLTTILHFTKNKPRPDVSIFVVSTTSRHTLPIDEFKFQAVVPKGYKLRLMPPSGESFPPFTPFLPPAAITQIMLIAYPLNEKIKEIYLKYVITYNGEDDMMSEIGEIKNLILDEVD